MQIIKMNLEEIIMVIDGISTMTDEIDNLLNMIFDNIVPSSIKKYSYPSNKPLGAWIEDLCHRLKFITEWIE